MFGPRTDVWDVSLQENNKVCTSCVSQEPPAPPSSQTTHYLCQCPHPTKKSVLFPEALQVKKLNLKIKCLPICSEWLMKSSIMNT